MCVSVSPGSEGSQQKQGNEKLGAVFKLELEAIVGPAAASRLLRQAEKKKPNKTEDSQFFIILQDEPLFEGEYTPVGKVLYGLDVLKKIKYESRSEYILRPDFINSFKMLN